MVTTKPSVVRLLAASAPFLPTTFGATSPVLPLDTYIVTLLPGATAVSPSGSVRITRPASITSLVSNTTVTTKLSGEADNNLMAAAWSSPITSGTRTVLVPAETLTVTTEFGRAPRPAVGDCTRIWLAGMSVDATNWSTTKRNPTSFSTLVASCTERPTRFGTVTGVKPGLYTRITFSPWRARVSAIGVWSYTTSLLAFSRTFGSSIGVRPRSMRRLFASSMLRPITFGTTMFAPAFSSVKTRKPKMPSATSAMTEMTDPNTHAAVRRGTTSS